MNARPIVTAPESRKRSARFGWAWLALAGALALHVTDEALTDFLSVYNPVVRAIRDRLPWMPLPVFSFRVWLAGLIAGILLLVILTPLAFRAVRPLVWAAMPLGVIMIGNGLGHLGGSLYLGRFMPGVYSSPLLIVASWLLLRGALGVNRLRRRPC